MSHNLIKINSLKFIFITGIIFASFYNFAKPSYAVDPGSTTITPVDATTVIGGVIVVFVILMMNVENLRYPDTANLTCPDQT